MHNSIFYMLGIAIFLCGYPAKGAELSDYEKTCLVGGVNYLGRSASIILAGEARSL